MRNVLVIFALWILVIEPTFRAFELMDEQSSECQHSDAGTDCCDADQPIPPSEIIPSSWVNEHSLLAFAPLILLDSHEWVMRHDSLVCLVASEPLTGGLSLPYPPSALPLRL